MAGFIENLRNGLASFFDGGQSNTQHLSDISDEQKQKWYDERAQGFVKNFRDAHSGAKIENGRRGDELEGTVMAPVGEHVNNQVSSGATAARNKPGIYEFIYTVPKDYKNMDSRDRDVEKGLIYIIGDDSMGPYPNSKDSYVYGATLADGTKLTGKEFEEFIASSPNQVAFSKLVKSADSTTRSKNDLAKQYIEMSERYANNPYIGPESPRKHIEWDKKKRMWMAK